MQLVCPPPSSLLELGESPHMQMHEPRAGLKTILAPDVVWLIKSTKIYGLGRNPPDEDKYELSP